MPREVLLSQKKGKINLSKSDDRKGEGESECFLALECASSTQRANSNKWLSVVTELKFRVPWHRAISSDKVGRAVRGRAAFSRAGVRKIQGHQSRVSGKNRKPHSQTNVDNEITSSPPPAQAGVCDASSVKLKTKMTEREQGETRKEDDN